MLNNQLTRDFVFYLVDSMNSHVDKFGARTLNRMHNLRRFYENDRE